MNCDCIRRLLGTTKSNAILVALIALWCSFFVVYGNEGSVVAEAEPPPYGVTFPAKVVRVVDGDTIEVEVTRTVRIRLLDCWAPETRTRDAEEKLKGFAAKAFLEERIQNKNVKVYVPVEPGGKLGDSFSFRRALAHVWLDGEGQSLSETMVNSGHATRTRNDE